MLNKLFKKSSKQKVAVGMSGGVDSSLSAHLLKEQGYDVTGVYLQCWDEPGCSADQAHKDALKIALDLKIPFKVLDFSKEYKERVIDHFFKEYKAGRTPNPDVLCNRDIKFGLFYDWAIKKGFEFVATGHYADVTFDEKEGDFRLIVPKDKHKDQTYFMYLLGHRQLSHILFPLSDMTKDEVRAEAKKRKLHVADKKDSVGVCFIGNVDVSKMLKEKFGEKPGNVVDVDGNIIGRHKGLWFYTIGQRGGFSIDQTSLIKTSDGETVTKQNIPPFYVIEKKLDKNQLVVGFGPKTLKDKFQVDNLYWINQVPTQKKLLVRIRHTGELLDCTVKINNEQATITLKESIRGIAPGQSAVFYLKQGKETFCLGGGIITLDPRILLRKCEDDMRSSSLVRG
jgi:tRNA-uridine 2-sulfurtransferase